MRGDHRLKERKRVAGLVSVADPIKETMEEAIDKLHEENVHMVMLTGDNETTAKAVADKFRIDEYVAEVLPEGKAAAVKDFQMKGDVVTMAGDGMNDAPALAQAEVGIAMGTGTDVAMESVRITLINGDLRGIVRGRLFSKATMANIKQNLFFAFVYNALGVPIAAGVLYPVFGLLLSSMIAAAAMRFSSVSLVMNALRLGRVTLIILKRAPLLPLGKRRLWSSKHQQIYLGGNYETLHIYRLCTYPFFDPGNFGCSNVRWR